MDKVDVFGMTKQADDGLLYRIVIGSTQTNEVFFDTMPCGSEESARSKANEWLLAHGCDIIKEDANLWKQSHG